MPSSPWPFLDHPGPLPFAHRGGAGDWPENTMPAFEGAVALGFGWVETDAHVTADGICLAFHDDRLDRVTDRTGIIAELPYREVRQARVDGREPIPLMEDLLGTFPDIRINIDPKHDGAVDALAAVIERTGSIDRVCVGSFSDQRIERLRAALGPRLCNSLGPKAIGRLRGGSFGLPSGHFEGTCAQVPQRYKGVPVTDRRFVERAHAVGLQVHVWTVDDPDEMHDLLDIGVDGIMTDRPAVLREVLRSRGAWFDRHPVNVRLAGPIAVGLGVRLAALAAGSGTARFRFADSVSYLAIARGLPSSLWAPSSTELSDTLARTPLYPALVRVSGGERHLLWIVLVQVVLGGAVNVWLAYRLATELAGPTRAAVAAPAAALVCALDPASIGLNLLVATETLAATLVLVALLAAHRTLRALADGETAYAPAAATGLATAALTMTRPNLAVFVPAAAVLVALATRHRRGIAAAGLALAVGIAPVAAWVVRNDRVAGSPVLSTVVGQNLAYFGVAAAATEDGDLRGVAIDRETFNAAVAATSEDVGLSPPIAGDTFSIATNRRWSDEGSALMRDHPRGVAVVAAKALARTAAAPGVTGALRPIGVAWLLALYGLVAVGVWFLASRRRWSDLALLAGTVAVYLAAALGPWAYVRFRVPMVGPLAVLAGLGAAQLGSVKFAGRPSK